MKGKLILAIGGGLLLGMAGVVNADAPSNTDLQAQVKALQDQVAQLQGQQDGTWMNEQRAEQVKAMVKEVLADADTRASLVGTGATAGFNGTDFFLASDDGNMSLTFWGLIQVAYIANFRDHPETNKKPASTGNAVADAEASILTAVRNVNSGNQGFRISRAQIFFDGTIGPPQFLYSVGVQTDESNEDNTLYRAWIGYRFQDLPLLLKIGQDFAPFMRESLVYEGYTLTAEKSLVNQIFGLDKVQGLFLEYDTNILRVAAALHDGSHSGVAQAALTNAALTSTLNSTFNNLPTTLTAANIANLTSGLASGIGAISVDNDFDNTPADFALTGRADIKLMGIASQWDQYKEFASLPTDESLFFGAAFDYEKLKTGAMVADDAAYTMAWTVDSTYKLKGLSIFGSVTGAYQHVGYDVPIRGGGTTNLFSNYGTVLQAGYLLDSMAIEPFVRWEYIDIDNRTSPVSVPDVNILTFGANYYFKRQAAKLTCDVVWATNSLSGQATGFADMTQEGLLPDYHNNKQQVAVRIQFQLMF